MHLEKQKGRGFLKIRIVKGPLGQHGAQQYPHHRDNRRRRERASIENLFEELMTNTFLSCLGKKTYKSRKCRES